MFFLIFSWSPFSLRAFSQVLPQCRKMATWVNKLGRLGSSSMAQPTGNMSGWWANIEVMPENRMEKLDCR